MAGADILQTHDGHDITRLRGIDHASVIRVHLTMRPIRSVLPVAVLTRVSPLLIVPE